MTEDGLQREQRIKLRNALRLALQTRQRRAGERVAQSVERSGHTRALARFGEDRADAPRRECMTVIGEEQGGSGSLRA